MIGAFLAFLAGIFVGFLIGSVQGIRDWLVSNLTVENASFLAAKYQPLILLIIALSLAALVLNAIGRRGA